MKYIINIKKRAKKFIDKQPQNQKIRLYQAISKLPEGDVKKLQTKKQRYRLRVGEYRIIFEWLDNSIYIDVTETDNRGDIYKNIN